jgi:hypothetical protein
VSAIRRAVGFAFIALAAFVLCFGLWVAGPENIKLD